MTSERSGTRCSTVGAVQPWREAYAMALKESDPKKVIGRIEYAIIAIERRYSQWGTDPGTPAELSAIQKCISALRRLMKEEQVRERVALVSTVGRPGVMSLRLQLEYLKLFTDLVGTSFH